MKLKTLGLLLATTTTIFASSLSVENAYVRATPPTLPNSAAFLTVKNTSDKNIAIISAKSDASNVAELHTHDMKNGVMSMYQVPQVDIKANSTVEFKPGGYHVMLLGLKQKPLKEGQNVNITLNLSNGENLKITVPVKKIMAGMMMKKHAMKKHDMKNGDMKKEKSAMSCGAGKCGK